MTRLVGVVGNSASYRARLSRAKTTASSPWRKITRACSSVRAGPGETNGASMVIVIVMAPMSKDSSKIDPSVPNQSGRPLQTAKVLRIFKS